MTPDELSAVTASVEKQIEVTVNGKIRVIDAKVDKLHTVLENVMCQISNNFTF